MKKYSLTLILVLCLFVITGGTYAAWTYYSSAVVALENSENSVTIETATNGGAKGEFQTTGSTLKITIDPKADESDYTAVLNISGSYVVNYVATDSHADPFKGFRVATTVSGMSQYQNADILTANAAYVDVTDTNTLTIDSAWIKANFTFGDFVLNNKAEHEAFETALGQGKINITVSEIA